MSSDADVPQGTYLPACSPFCDGFEVRLGHVQRQDALESSADLRQMLQRNLKNMIVKHALYTQRCTGTAIWITLNPETATINSYTMTDLSIVLKTVKEYARLAWGYTER